MNKKTVLENLMDKEGLNQSELSKKTNVLQSVISRDLKSNNSLKMAFKYAKLLKIKTLDFEGIEHGMYVKGTAKINQ